MNEVDEQLQDFLIRTSANLLNCDPSQVGWTDDLDEYGYSSITLNQLCALVNERFSIEVTPAVFLEHTSLAAFAAYCREHHLDRIEAALDS